MNTGRQSTHVVFRIPRATYRLQFNENFRLADGLALVPYLHELGVSHVYSSPLLKARPHSAHGYDVCDFSQLNPELGTEEDLARLVEALHKLHMGLVLDIVPNHMGIGGPENHWWWDVLARGQASKFANYFDIDWQSPDPQLRGKVLVPVLAGSYDQILHRGELRVAEETGEMVLRYFDHVFPLTLPALPTPYACSGDASAAARAAELNANPKALDKLLGQQHYLLASWTQTDAKINYRRFFNVATLAGLRVEEQTVFTDTHALIRKWLQNGWVDGLRVDHPDGLRDSGEYLTRLRGLAPGAWIVVEKILQPGESLPASWPVEGSTGYDFLNQVVELLVDQNGERPLTEFYTAFTGEPADYIALVIEKKRWILRHMLTAEVERLTRILTRIVEGAGDARAFTKADLSDAIIEVAVGIQVYRTFVSPVKAGVDEKDVGYIEAAVAAARRQCPDLPRKLLGLLTDLLLLRKRGDLESDFVLRFQQFTGPVMAKGVEDTAFYCFNRLAALNEVGGNPGCFGLSIDAFHQACQAGRGSTPSTMLTTSTHDTKRSEDVRARLCLLSEIPGTWSEIVRQWSAMNQPHHQDGWPDRNAEYLFYQTLVGAWPLSLERALAYMEKAVFEARQHTTFNQRNPAYENALRNFISAVLSDDYFRRDVERFVAALTDAGYINSLAQTLVKLTAPGVPDIYQGCELWDWSLVDPDNRRPVDFARRRDLSAEVKCLSASEIWGRRDEGLPKLWLISRVLGLRAREPQWFAGTGSYEPLYGQGAKREHIVAYVRGDAAITVIQRLPLVLQGDWADATLPLPPGEWQNELGGERTFEQSAAIADLLSEFPVALLTRKGRA